jgi:predicted nuclease of predicted toxin-antitoxin system
MPLSIRLAEWLRTHGAHAVHTSEIGMSKSPDFDILTFALQEEFVTITADLDFPRLLAQLGHVGPGLILLRGGNFSERESIDCVSRVLKAIPSDELPKSLVVVDGERIRRCWCPSKQPNLTFSSLNAVGEQQSFTSLSELPLETRVSLTMWAPRRSFSTICSTRSAVAWTPSPHGASPNFGSTLHYSREC